MGVHSGPRFEDFLHVNAAEVGYEPGSRNGTGEYLSHSSLSNVLGSLTNDLTKERPEEGRSSTRRPPLGGRGGVRSAPLESVMPNVSLVCRIFDGLVFAAFEFGSDFDRFASLCLWIFVYFEALAILERVARKVLSSTAPARRNRTKKM